MLFSTRNDDDGSTTPAGHSFGHIAGITRATVANRSAVVFSTAESATTRFFARRTSIVAALKDQRVQTTGSLSCLTNCKLLFDGVEDSLYGCRDVCCNPSSVCILSRINTVSYIGLPSRVSHNDKIFLSFQHTTTELIKYNFVWNLLYIFRYSLVFFNFIKLF